MSSTMGFFHYGSQKMIKIDLGWLRDSGEEAQIQRVLPIEILDIVSLDYACPSPV